MAMPGAGSTDAKREHALLRIATLIARDTPDEILFAAVAEQAAAGLGVEASSILRFVGDERAVVVGVWNDAGVRGFPVNAELDFDRTNSAAGRVRATGRPARADSYEHGRGELPVQLRAINLRSSVAAPVMLGDDVWGVVVALTTRDQPLPAGAENELVDFAELVGLAVADGEAKRRAAAARRRTVEAGDEARRRLERELHDGIQQHLLALTLKVRLARTRAAGESEVARLLDEALAEAAVANSTLRELARGLYPIALTERGLAPALQALVARAGVPVYLRELPRRRFPALAEATAYFMVADTLAVARADDAEVAVVVSDRGDRLLVELRSGGVLGSDAVADRVTAVGGHLHVGTLPDGGSVMRAEIPV
jgi:signal transduction histidine kinase